MFTTVVVLCVVGYGAKKLAGFAKNNAGQSVEVMRRLRQMFGK